MTTTEKFCLKWNDFKENVNSTFLSLRKDTDFTDVTLACEDNKQVEAHKVILAASSSFFQNVLKRNKHAHPLIYLKGMKYEDLLAIIDFIYEGETNIFQDNLDSFLSSAEDLCLKGLARETNALKEENFPNPLKPLKPSGLKFQHKSIINSPQKQISDSYYQPQSHSSGIYDQPEDNDIDKYSQDQEPILDRTVGISEDYNKTYKMGTSENFNETLNSMISKIGENWTCNSCGKVTKDRGNLKRHVENMHTEGLEFPCTRCDKMFRSKKCLYNHNASKHK